MPGWLSVSVLQAVGSISTACVILKKGFAPWIVPPPPEYKSTAGSLSLANSCESLIRRLVSSAARHSAQDRRACARGRSRSSRLQKNSVESLCSDRKVLRTMSLGGTSMCWSDRNSSRWDAHQSAWRGYLVSEAYFVLVISRAKAVLDIAVPEQNLQSNASNLHFVPA